MHKPHMPWQFNAEDLAHHPIDSIDLPTHPMPPTGVPGIALTFSDGTADKGAHTSPWVPISNASTVAARRAYRAAVTGMDRKLGSLLDEIDKLGIANNTAVVFHSDHGWHLGEHGEWRKMTNFEAVARVPMMIRAPWLNAAGSRSDALVELVDVLPTIAELAGIPLPPDETFDGVSLMPLLQPSGSLRPSVSTKSAVFSQYPRKVKHPSTPWKSNDPIHDERTTFTHMGYSVRTSEYRYTEWLPWNQSTLKPLWGQAAAAELYDHRGLPSYPTNFNLGENSNQINVTAFAPVVAKLSSLLKMQFGS